MAYPNSDLTIPFATVFTTFLLWFVSLTPIRIAQSKQEEGYDNSRPREQYSRLPEWGKRAVAASNNTFEGLCFFIRIAADFFCIAFVILRVRLPVLRKTSFRGNLIEHDISMTVYSDLSAQLIET
ncbi:32720_t:CDS:2 [Gigaspora margarita]|uniref:32720_t:CDS:1 n=1 Tax=Gigaspora margarita TaxID=4874 RepID=A0ABN7VYF0_GIGMA|nr:32720_t:CDS:2 [Gigaspora margarita]